MTCRGRVSRNIASDGRGASVSARFILRRIGYRVPGASCIGAGARVALAFASTVVLDLEPRGRGSHLARRRGIGRIACFGRCGRRLGIHDADGRDRRRRREEVIVGGLGAGDRRRRPGSLRDRGPLCTGDGRNLRRFGPGQGVALDGRIKGMVRQVGADPAGVVQQGESIAPCRRAAVAHRQDVGDDTETVDLDIPPQLRQGRSGRAAGALQVLLARGQQRELRGHIRHRRRRGCRRRQQGFLARSFDELTRGRVETGERRAGLQRARHQFGCPRL